MIDKMRAAVSDILRESYFYCKQKDGTFEMEIYADYRDEMSGKTAAEICGSSDPWLALWEKMQEWYFEAECQYRSDLEKELREKLESDDGPYHGGLGDAEDEFEAVMEELVCWTYPEDHFLKQEFFVNIMLDTGDGNYDYTLNSAYPCWYGQYDARLDEKSPYCGWPASRATPRPSFGELSEREMWQTRRDSLTPAGKNWPTCRPTWRR